MCTPELMGNAMAGMLVAAHPGNGSSGGNLDYTPGSVHKNVLATLFSAGKGAGNKTNTTAPLGSNFSQGGQFGALASMFAALGGNPYGVGYAPGSTIGGPAAKTPRSGGVVTETQ